MIEYFITTYAGELLMVLLCAIAGTLGYAVKKVWVAVINDEAKAAIAKYAVKFVEQVWKELHGKDKLMKALETAATLLHKKGIDYDAEEMTILIEAALAEFNKAFAVK